MQNNLNSLAWSFDFGLHCSSVTDRCGYAPSSRLGLDRAKETYQITCAAKPWIKSIVLELAE
jgi:hypothetical protein